MTLSAAFTLARVAETSCSTSGELRDSGCRVLCKILERGAHNLAHPRIPAGRHRLALKPFGASRFDSAYRELIGKAYRGILWLPDVPGRANIEIHTANLVQQLEGCLATGDEIARDRHGDFMIAGATSRPAYARIYPILSAAIDDGGGVLCIRDIATPSPRPRAWREFQSATNQRRTTMSATTINPVQLFVQKLELFAERAKEKIAAFAGAFLPQAESDIEIALGDLAELALDAVLAQAGTVASGREKFGKAVTSVVQTVEKNGKTVLQQTAEMAVQQAYLTAQSIAQANAAD